MRESGTESKLQVFAKEHRLRVRRDSCGDPIITGKHGDISDNHDGRLLACFHGIIAEPFSRARSRRIRDTLALGHGTRVQGGIGCDEASFTFDPSDSRAAICFIRALEIRRKRRVSPGQAERLRARLLTSARASSVPAEERISSLQEAFSGRG